MENISKTSTGPSPVAGVRSASPAVRSPTAGSEGGITPIPATPADPSFIVSPTPPPAFQGFSATPQPQGCVGKTPTSSPVAFGMPSHTPTTAVVTVTSPVEGQTSRRAPTPGAASNPPSAVKTAVGPSPAPPTRALGPADLGLTPPPPGYVYGEQNTPDPMARLSGAADCPSVPPTVRVGLHTPTWNTPPVGSQTGFTPVLKEKNACADLEPKTLRMNNCVINGLFGKGESGSPLSMPLKKMEDVIAAADQPENQPPVEA